MPVSLEELLMRSVSARLRTMLILCERARCYLGGVSSPTPTASMGGSVSGGPVAQVDSSLVRVHERVRDSMFYI